MGRGGSEAGVGVNKKRVALAALAKATWLIDVTSKEEAQQNELFKGEQKRSFRERQRPRLFAKSLTNPFSEFIPQKFTDMS